MKKITGELELSARAKAVSAPYGFTPSCLKGLSQEERDKKTKEKAEAAEDKSLPSYYLGGCI